MELVIKLPRMQMDLANEAINVCEVLSDTFKYHLRDFSRWLATKPCYYFHQTVLVKHKCLISSSWLIIWVFLRDSKLKQILFTSCREKKDRQSLDFVDLDM